MTNKKSIFYINLILFIIVALIAVNNLNLPGHSLIQKALAAVSSITGEGTVNFIARFAGASNPSNQIGDSTIYDDGAGHVGIGTTGPQRLLDVEGSTAGIRIKETDFANFGGFIEGRDTAGVETWFVGKANHDHMGGTVFGIGTENSLPLELYTNDAPRVTILSNGNVGIGTTNPKFRLHVVGGNANSESMTLNSNTTGNFVLSSAEGSDFGLVAGVGNSGNAWLQVGRYSANASTYYNLVLQPSGGNVGIGTTNPGAKLEINGAMKLTPLASDPSGLSNGVMWMRQ